MHPGHCLPSLERWGSLGTVLPFWKGASFPSTQEQAREGQPSFGCWSGVWAGGLASVPLWTVPQGKCQGPGRGGCSSPLWGLSFGTGHVLMCLHGRLGGRAFLPDPSRSLSRPTPQCLWLRATQSWRAELVKLLTLVGEGHGALDIITRCAEGRLPGTDSRGQRSHWDTDVSPRARVCEAGSRQHSAQTQLSHLTILMMSPQELCGERHPPTIIPETDVISHWGTAGFHKVTWSEQQRPS